MADLSDILKYLENKDLKIFFSGIGGISMHAIAAVLHQKGYKVCGSDIDDDKNEVKNLRNLGIDVFIPHKRENISEDCDLLVYMARIKPDNPEIIRAKELNIPIVKRLQMLGALMSGYKKSIGISGTHGKSSVTSMTSEIFMQAKTDPTFFIGAVYPPINSAYKIGKEDFFILESDEYSDSFLNLYPNISVILNIEMDHPDYFKDLSHVISSFEKFLDNTSDCAIINGDDENAIKAVKNFKSEIITYSLKNPSADIFVKNTDNKNIFPEFDIIAKGEFYAHVKLLVPGEFNIYNAAAAASVAYKCKIPGKFVEAGLNIFKGAGRRFEYKGVIKSNGAKVYDDYAHHPTEVKKALTEMQKIANKNNGKLWYVFQPHTYSRTHELLDDLCEALSHADNLILTEIYSATEKNIYDIYSKDISAKLKNSVFIEDFEEIAEYLKKVANKNDLIVITGAGDINNLTKLLV
ncbi:MAG: UDP-N-acetylmuramate--L-alanine ligase [Oscillospiraceae bacterium]|nr:UDP-N-acetylmuramate--L-alanine ligase [Oscillospiraceae bacterium]